MCPPGKFQVRYEKRFFHDARKFYKFILQEDQIKVTTDDNWVLGVDSNLYGDVTELHLLRSK